MRNMFSLRAGQKLHLLSVAEKNTDFEVEVAEIGQLYTAVSFASLKDEEYLALTANILAGTPYTFSSCLSDGVYTFSCGYRGSELLPVKKIYFEHPKVDERIQRRNFIRIPFEAGVSYSVISDLVEKMNGTQLITPAHFKGRSFAKAAAVNISAGGMLIRMGNALDAGESVAIILELPTVKTLVLTAEVMHCEDAKGYPGEYLIGVQFNEQVKRGPENMKFTRALAELQREWMKRSRR